MNFGVGQLLTKTFICGGHLRKCVHFCFLQRNIYDHMAVVAPILQLCGQVYEFKN